MWWQSRNLTAGPPTFLTFLPGAVAALLLYLVCAATLPDSVPETGLDLEEFYYSSRRQFRSLVGVMVLLRLCLGLWNVLRANFAPQIVALNAPFLLVGLAALPLVASMIYVRKSWWHAVGIGGITAMTFVTYAPMKL